MAYCSKVRLDNIYCAAQDGHDMENLSHSNVFSAYNYILWACHGYATHHLKIGLHVFNQEGKISEDTVHAGLDITQQSFWQEKF